MKADFMKLPVPDESYDAVYAIEATCHAPDKVEAVHRALPRDEAAARSSPATSGA